MTVIFITMTGCELSWTPPSPSLEAAQALAKVTTCNSDALKYDDLVVALDAFERSPECASSRCRAELTSVRQEQDPELLCHSIRVLLQHNGVGHDPPTRLLSWFPRSYWILVLFVLWIFGKKLIGIIGPFVGAFVEFVRQRKQHLRLAFLGVAAWWLVLEGVNQAIEYAPAWTGVVVLAASCALVSAAILVLPKVIRWAQGRWISLIRIPLGVATTSLNLISLKYHPEPFSKVLLGLGAATGLLITLERLRKVPSTDSGRIQDRRYERIAELYSELGKLEDNDERYGQLLKKLRALQEEEAEELRRQYEQYESSRPKSEITTDYLEAARKALKKDLESA